MEDIINIDESTASTSEQSKEEKDPKRRSTIYNHFTEDKTKNRWKCNYCRSTYQKTAGGGTGSLHNHMKSQHPSKLVPVIQKKISEHMHRVEKGKTEVRTDKLTVDEFYQKLVKFIVTSDQPFSIVEDGSFEDLITKLQGSNPMNLPGRTKTRELISETFQVMKTKIKDSIKTCDSRLNFVIDCWSSANGHSFQGVIASWIDKNWTIKTAVIDLTRIYGTHTGENLANHFIQVLDDFEAYQKLLTITTDNAGNMGTLFRHLDFIVMKRNEQSQDNVSQIDDADSSEELEDITGCNEKAKTIAYPMSNFKSKDHRVRCLAHIINLSCQAILSVLDNSRTEEEDDSDSDQDTDANEFSPVGVISKLRKAIKKIRNSQEKRDCLRSQCHVAKLKPNELILDMRVRWNSTLNMIERALQLQGPLNLTIANFPDLGNLKLTIDEWKKLDDIKQMLSPFKDATLLFSQNAPMLSSTLHIYEILFAHLETFLEEGNTSTTYRGGKTSSELHDSKKWLQSSALAGWKKLKKYYPSADGLAYKVATDPTRKDKWYGAVGWNSDWIRSCKSDVKRLWITDYKNKDESSQEVCIQEPATKKQKKNSVEEKIAEQMMSIPKVAPEDELARYLREPCAPRGTHILEWWKIHEITFPNLSKMAKDFLSIFGTGVPVERLFSSATDTLTHRRFRLNPKSINECLCLKSWYKLENGQSLHAELADAVKEMILGDTDVENSESS